MSRSYKKPIIKGKSKCQNKRNTYHRRIRRRIETAIKSSKDLENLELPHPKTIVNDYDYCDWKYSPLFCSPTKWTNQEQLDRDKIKYSRK